MLLNIDNTNKRPTSPHPILNLGFRIFFVGASTFSVLAMLLWLLILQGVLSFNGQISPFYWHGHEMIFGYALAVIAGFLLTAVKTWTNQRMPFGYQLLTVFTPWLMARILWLIVHATPSMTMLILALVFDMLFWGSVSYFVIKAVVKAQQKRQIGIVAKLILLFLSHGIFYVATLTNNTSSQKTALYFALYLVIGVVFTIARRVLPFFISKGVGVDSQGHPNGIVITQKNSDLLDRISLVSFAGFVMADLLNHSKVASIFALVCMMANWLRIKNWYHHGIWQKPLLWSLVIAFAGMVGSLMFFVCHPFVSTDANLHSLGLHGLAVFGIGLMTLSMMARVSLGHTGRNIHSPPKAVHIIFALMILCAICRVLMPVMFANYTLLLFISQIAWIVAFGLFCVCYTGILSKPRVDGLFG